MEPLNAAQAIAHNLREKILSGALKPNTRVTQRDLAAEHGHSPMPARDAVKILLAEGLVVQEGIKTVLVAPASAEDFAEIMEIRGLLEPRALELSMRHLSAADFNEARAALEFSGTTDEPRQLVNSHWRFHRALYCQARSPRLLALIEQQHNLLIRYLLHNWAGLGLMPGWSKEESELLDLVERGLAAQAKEWLRRDLQVTANRLSQGLPDPTSL